MNEEYKELIGKTVRSCSQDADSINLVFDDGVAEFYHDQDCCESVEINSIVGDIDDLCDQKITNIQEFIGDEYAPFDWGKSQDFYYDESWTWTKYRIETEQSVVEILWFGTSNGYYSESVNYHWRPSVPNTVF